MKKSKEEKEGKKENKGGEESKGGKEGKEGKVEAAKASADKKKELAVKIHGSSPKIIAICDYELLEKYFEEGKLQLEVNRAFFDGQRLSIKEAERLLKELLEDYCSFNIVGKKAIELALKLNIVDEKRILKIQEIPVAISL
ncbi:MAG: DUF424 domain-containing protein [Candidatus Pacearchaeota archaeon]